MRNKTPYLAISSSPNLSTALIQR